MAIVGTALLAVCLLTGLLIGELLGRLMSIDANIGGVGFAMLLLILTTGKLQQAGHLSPPSANGIAFWSSIYIPIVVAMAASQNVRGALNGGAAALVAGVAVVVVCFALVPLVGRLGQPGALSVSSEAAPDQASTGEKP